MEASTETFITGCKINLTLKVGSIRSDGYHSINSLMLPLSTPSDTITASYVSPLGAESLQKCDTVTVNCTNATIAPQFNTLTLAHSLFIAERPLGLNISFMVAKEVPVGAGLGGGSANAAGVLRYLNTLAEKTGTSPLDENRMLEIAVKVGSDVPFFLKSEPQTVCGKGEILLQANNPCAGKFLVLLCPSIAVSTAWAYNELDLAREKDVTKNKCCLTSDKQIGISSNSCEQHFQNDFEEVVFPAFPELRELRDYLLQSGANVALLTGTGASLFGIFTQREQAEKAAEGASVRAFVQGL